MNGGGGVLGEGEGVTLNGESLAQLLSHAAVEKL